MRTRRSTAITALAWLLLLSLPARADELDGTWSGDVELRGNYFLERSTRVVVPTARVGLVSPTGWRVGGDVLIDSITSASIAQGAQTDDLFTERRWAFGANVGRALELGTDTSLEWTAFGRYSFENDYFATSFGFDTLLALAERCSLLRLNATAVLDRVEKSTDTNFEEPLRGASWRLSYEQILTPVLTVTLAWDFAYLDGFLANVYRTIAVPGEGRLSENHPDTRFRHAPSLQARLHVPQTRTSFHLRARPYWDSWEINAFTAEARIYQELGEHFVGRVRYRYYDQSAAFFADNLSGRGTADHLVTADPKMPAHRTQELGFKVELRLPWLEAISLGEAWFDMSFDYRWNTNRFGDGLMAQAGMRVPF